MTVFMRSYSPAMRSNIARTWVSSSVPGEPDVEDAMSGAEFALAVMIPRARLLQL
jgi:hypothetical protein